MDDRGKLIRLPMKYIHEEWVLEYGGDLPIEHGASGELVMEASSIRASEAKDLFLKEERIRILPEGTPLRALVDVRDWSSITQEQMECLGNDWKDVYPYCCPVPLSHISPSHRMIEVRLARPNPRQASYLGDDGGGLWLRTQGVTSIGFISSTVTLPLCISNKTARSLNHAYTLLSEAFEPWRTSHTGSVYRLVFYQEVDGNWYPLRLLRDSRLAEKSQQIAQELWKQISRKHAAWTA